MIVNLISFIGSPGSGKTTAINLFQELALKDGVKSIIYSSGHFKECLAHYLGMKKEYGSSKFLFLYDHCSSNEEAEELRKVKGSLFLITKPYESTESYVEDLYINTSIHNGSSLDRLIAKLTQLYKGLRINDRV